MVKLYPTRLTVIVYCRRSHLEERRHCSNLITYVQYDRTFTQCANLHSVMHGPILLGAKTGTEDLAGLIAHDGRWEHIADGKKLPIDKAPIIIEDNLSQS